MIFLSLLACPHNSHANPPDGDVLIGPGEPFAFWAVERALFPGESVRFTVAVADGGFANGKSFVLDGEPTVQSIGPNTLWMPKDVDPYSIGFEAMNNGGEPLQETIEVYATWKEQLDPPAGGGKGAPAEPEMIDGVGSGFAYTDRPVFLFTYPGTRMQFADGETKIDFSVTAAANGAALDMNVYDIKGETAWDITENPAGVNTIVGSVKSGDEGEGNLKITHGGKTQGTSTKEIAFTDFDIAISAFGTEPDLKEDRKPEGGNGQPPHEMEPGGVVLVPVAVTGQLPTQGKRAKLSLSGHSAGGGTYTLKTSGSDKVKIYPNEIPTEGENPLPGEKTWPASDFSSDMTFYVGSESFAPVDNSSEATLTFTHKRALGGDPADAELKDETKVVLVNIQLEPDAGMVGIVGDTVPSVNPRSKISHFVSPKKTAQIPADDVILKISGLDAKYVSPGNAAHILEWDSAVGQAIPGEPTKRKFSRSTPGKYSVKVKTKSGSVVLLEKIVWIIWTEAATTVGTTDLKIVTTGDLTGSSYTAATDLDKFWKFVFKIVPQSILDQNTTERPMLSNNPTNPVPGEGVHHRGDPANPSGDSATRQWDVSRQIQVLIKNPDGISKEAMAAGNMSPGFIANQPVAEDVPIAFPALDTEGNDDPLTPDEDVNPYAAKVGNALDHAFGELSSQDAPSARVLTNYHPPGNKFSVELNFREFARLEIWDGNRQTGKFWFRISDFKTWHHYLDAKYEEDKWVDGSSSHGLGHPNP